MISDDEISFSSSTSTTVGSGSEEERNNPPDLQQVHKSFIDSCRTGSIREVRRFLRRRNSDVNFKLFSWTGLHTACSNGRRNVARLLLQRDDCLVNEQNLSGDTPLHLACQFNHMEIVELLLCRSDINSRIKNDRKKFPIRVTNNEKIRNLIREKEKELQIIKREKERIQHQQQQQQQSLQEKSENDDDDKKKIEIIEESVDNNFDDVTTLTTSTSILEQIELKNKQKLFGVRGYQRHLQRNQRPQLKSMEEEDEDDVNNRTIIRTPRLRRRIRRRRRITPIVSSQEEEEEEEEEEVNDSDVSQRSDIMIEEEEEEIIQIRAFPNISITSTDESGDNEFLINPPIMRRLEGNEFRGMYEGKNCILRITNNNLRSSKLEILGGNITSKTNNTTKKEEDDVVFDDDDENYDDDENNNKNEEMDVIDISRVRNLRKEDFVHALDNSRVGTRFYMDFVTEERKNKNFGDDNDDDDKELVENRNIVERKQIVVFEEREVEFEEIFVMELSKYL